ncbi:MAG: hypothetical protein JNJ54_33365 [Myxococcaceae bacterium]|nr:hypothetical protein [Myxococcaceae bacterium]
MKLSNLPFAALCFGLLLGGVASTSCGPSRPVCSPSTCATGCCSASGSCVSIPSSSECGSRGEQCKMCLLGQTCSFGTCMGGNTGAGTSGGGFVTSGGSAGGSTGGGSAGGGFGGGSTGGGFGGGSTGGGFGGGSTGGGFGGGSTSGGSATCNSGNCSSGCCQGSACISPPSNANNVTCGFGGFACVDCTSFGQACNSVTFMCSGAGGGSGGGFGGGSVSGDDCTSPVPLTLVSGSAATSGSLNSGYANNTTSCAGTGPDAVYSVSLPTTGTLTAQVTAFGFTPRVSIRSVCTNTTNLACDSAPSSGVATATTNQLAAGTYYVWVDSSSSSASGSYSLSVSASGAGGGGAGGGTGGGFGGGGVGGGSGAGYTMSSITASCDSFTTGAVDLLTATTTPPVSDDVTTGIFPLGLTLNFFGTPVSFGSVQTNGMVQVYTSSAGTPSNAWSNGTIPSTAVPNGFIAPYWDDLYTAGVTGEAVRSKVFVDHLTIAWVNPLGTGTEFQAKFFNATGVAEFHYCNIGSATGSGASIGAEDLNGLSGVQYTSGVATGSGVRLTP